MSLKQYNVIILAANNILLWPVLLNDNNIRKVIFVRGRVVNIAVL